MSDNMDLPQDDYDYYAYDPGYFPQDHPVRQDSALVGLRFHPHRAAVVGLPYPNPDGSSRMDVAERLQERQLVLLVREPDNQYDPNAVAVYEVLWHGFPNYEIRPSGQFGYLPRGLAEDYAPLMDAGAMLFGIVEEKVRNKSDRLSSVKIRTGLLERAPEGMASGNSPEVSR